MDHGPPSRAYKLVVCSTLPQATWSDAGKEEPRPRFQDLRSSHCPQVLRQLKGRMARQFCGLWSLVRSSWSGSSVAGADSRASAVDCRRHPYSQ